MRENHVGTTAQFASGTELVVKVNDAESFKLLSLRVSLTTSAVVNNRFPHFQLRHRSGLVLLDILPNSPQTASNVWAYNLIGGQGALAEGSAQNGGVVSVPLPDMWLPHGTQIITSTTNLDAGDGWGQVSYMYELGDEYERLERMELMLSDLQHQVGA